MAKDKRYNTVKILIEGGHVPMFRDIFEHIAKTQVAADMGIHFNKMNRIIDNADLLTCKEIFILSGLIGIDAKTLFELVYNQHNASRKVPRRK